MTFSPTKALLFSLAIAACSVTRGFGAQGDDVGEIKCVKNRNAEDCRKDWDSFPFSRCVWCESKAVPSQCVPPDLAEKLPKLVFKCDGEDGDEDEKGESSAETIKLEEQDGMINQREPETEEDFRAMLANAYFRRDHADTQWGESWLNRDWIKFGADECKRMFEEHMAMLKEQFGQIKEATADMLEADFDAWKDRFGVTYESKEEEEARYLAYQANLEEVNRHNLAASLGGAGLTSYTLGVNRFSDMTWEEFQATRLGFGSALGMSQNCSATHHREDSQYRAFGLSTGRAPPPRRDWRELGAVSVVKNQDHCGSCWTFSTTGCLESHHYLRTGEMVLLSEQQLVDCAGAYDNHGCSGGLPSHAFEYIAGAGGLDTEEAYPYIAEESGSCAFFNEGVGAGVMRAVNITFQDEAELLEAVGNTGPVSVAFQVAPDFKAYNGGVYDNPGCSTLPEEVNHAVLCVGYDTTDDGVDYWIIKNSWGADWGIDGYFHMVRGKNMCGVADCASFPLVP